MNGRAARHHGCGCGASSRPNICRLRASHLVQADHRPWLRTDWVPALCPQRRACGYDHPGSALAKVLDGATPLKREDRARLLNDSHTLFDVSEAAARLGDTSPPSADRAEKLGQHFVAFVKGRDGHLWELEGSRKGPLERGLLGEDEDLLSEKAVERGLGRLIKMQQAGGGDLRFSCVALALQDRYESPGRSLSPC
ncbi:hypothetical protein B0T22DRAFT_128469 [Podospora appendiculata]|uniref:ubiquitinyl hydrolase 1 n=1 Tax=Podospora appendiculata TaxID=314037 RepID=A0AAE0X7D3_9PEZI|nr:hypothetical protein B0T22DRAFT_128469 [Podospora appendiculata]